MTEIEKQIREALAKATKGDVRVYYPPEGTLATARIERYSPVDGFWVALVDRVLATDDEMDLLVLLRNQAPALLDRLAAAEAEVERLRAALRPFAQVGKAPEFDLANSPHTFDDQQRLRLVTSYGSEHFDITVGDCRRAAAALAKEDERA